MHSATSQRAIAVLTEYINGAERYLIGLVKKLGETLESLAVAHLHDLADMVALGAKIILGPEKADLLVADLRKI